jgi:hypothetical protein
MTFRHYEAMPILVAPLTVQIHRPADFKLVDFLSVFFLGKPHLLLYVYKKNQQKFHVFLISINQASV